LIKADGRDMGNKKYIPKTVRKISKKFLGTAESIVQE
jgi:hypothetical protein